MAVQGVIATDDYSDLAASAPLGAEFEALESVKRYGGFSHAS